MHPKANEFHQACMQLYGIHALLKRSYSLTANAIRVLIDFTGELGTTGGCDQPCPLGRARFPSQGHPALIFPGVNFCGRRRLKQILPSPVFLEATS